MSFSNTGPLFTTLSILSVFPLLSLVDLCLPDLPKALSSDKPANTNIVPVHCKMVRGCLKISTEPSIVKNLRVVVMMLQGSGPKYVTVRKIKFCKYIQAKIFTTYMYHSIISNKWPSRSLVHRISIHNSISNAVN